MSSRSRNVRRVNNPTHRVATAVRPFSLEPLESRQLLSTLPPGFTETLMADGLSSPTSMEFAPDGRVFVTEQGGSVRVIKDGKLLPTPFVTVDADSTGERGLLGVTVDPNFATNKYLYVYYTSADGASHNVVARFTATGDTATPASEHQILSLPPVGGGTWHMGGAMKFGKDGKLYVAVGDYQVPANAGSLENPAGKILRINKDGSIPTDNPFYDETTGVNRAIWALGVRNPFTLAVNPVTGAMFINEVGQSGFEEINVGAAGANYGWPGTEGPTSTPGVTAPLYSYTHADGIAIMGGAFYAGVDQSFPAQYANKYFFGDFGAGWVRALDPVTKTAATFATGLVFPTGFSAGADGSLWYLSRGAPSGGIPNTGQVYRIAYDAYAPPSVNSQPTDVVASVGDKVTFAVKASGGGTLTYKWFRNGAAIAGATAASYSISSVATTGNGAKFYCQVKSAYGTVTTRTAAMTVTTNKRPTATITSPATTATFAGNSTIGYAATATDAEDGALPASAFTWQVDYHTGIVTRPFLPPTSGSKSGSFVVPTETPYTEPDVFFRITLTVTDKTGLTYTTYRDVKPKTSKVTLTTNVPGAKVEIDGQPKAGPYVTTGVEGLRRTVGVPTTQTVKGVVYTFDHWSDGGDATHSVFFPVDDKTYTAYYVARKAVYLSDLPFAGAATNNWGPVERDQSNGEDKLDDGKPITLNGVTYAKGLGTHANSAVSFDLGGQYDRFIADVGVDDEVDNAGSVVFQVWADGVKVFDSGLMAGPSATKHVDVDVSGKLRLKLVALNGGDDGTLDHASWADAKLLVPLVKPAPPPASVYVSDLPLAEPGVNEWGPMERDRSNGEDGAADGGPITLDGVTYAKGLGVHADSTLVFDLDGKYAMFQSDVGIDDEVGDTGSAVFQVWADGVKLFDSGIMYGDSPTRSAEVFLAGKKQLKLVVTHDGDDVYNDHADWAGARLTLAPGTVTPPTVSVADAKVVEGNSGTRSLVFTVTRTDGATAATVKFSTSNVTATAGTDYTALTGTVSFAAGVVSKTVTVVVTGDTAVEADETLALTLSAPSSGLTIARAKATGTIANDDVAAKTLQAESAKLVGATVATQYAGYTGSGYAKFRTTPTSGDSVTWTVSAPAAGTRTLKFRFANGGAAAKNLELRVNGVVVRASLAFAATGAWGTWQTLTLTTALKAGDNTITLSSIGTGGPNLDSLIVS